MPRLELISTCIVSTCCARDDVDGARNVWRCGVHDLTLVILIERVRRCYHWAYAPEGRGQINGALASQFNSDISERSCTANNKSNYNVLHRRPRLLIPMFASSSTHLSFLIPYLRDLCIIISYRGARDDVDNMCCMRMFK